VANRVLDRFVEVGLIDDAAYAQAYVAAKHRERALGVAALRMELRRKGVADQTVDAAVSVLDQDAERERAMALISRRVDAAMAHGPVAARRRLVALLARRGYSAELACQVVDAALAEYGAETDDGWSG
jgi:regulatory protein